MKTVQEWHNVESTGSLCALVNCWWNAAPKRIESPMQALLHAFYSISSLPDNEREAWQAFFEYFVFQPDEPALSHLTDEEKGLFQTSLQHCQQLR
ncbi:hypothetical protein RS130_21225 [Paraglaciecola aquimarina]|uniref:Uncharacterized protein n=1 Tax=Paraglaciecola aquimarina TaxID=1235557 RepID=A0ABU3T1C4_9ALTE|nr:hypothetical protein [Paraglaciecola aquimarina]MDU0356076.1 hypothetical protein [Paraglaciecola aquimarina]